MNEGRWHWHCLECGRGYREAEKAVYGEYPEDGEVFCSKECKATYDKRG